MVGILLFLLSLAQTADTLEVDPEQFVDDATEFEEQAALLQEQITELALTKLDLNTAGEGEILSLPGIGVHQAHLLLAYRAKGGRFESRDDLLRAGLNRVAVEQLMHFITFPLKKPRPAVEITQRISRRIQTAEGFRGDPAAYRGGPTGVTTRMKLSAGRRFRAGAVVDKDSGERSGFDFSAGYVHLETGPFQSLIVGDYAVRLGEGLLIRQGAGGGNFAGAPVARPGRLFRPYASTAEWGFFRGIAFQTRTLLGLSIGAFASRRRLDGRIDSTGGITLLRSGLHRTSTERAGRRAVLEEAAGGLLTYEASAIRAGIATYAYRHSPGHGPDQTSRALSTAFVTLHRSTLLTSMEFAVRDRSISSSLSLEYEPVRRARISAAWRRTGPSGASLHTTIAGGAEDFLSTSLQLAISPAWRLTITSHRRRFASERQPFLLHSNGADARLEFRPRRWITAALQLRQRRAEIGSVCSAGFHAVTCTDPLRRRSLRLQVDYSHSASFRARMRLEAIGAENLSTSTTHHGLLLLEDIRWAFAKGFRLDLRLTLFDTSGYEARAYAVEDDLLYSFSSPALIGRGRRGYVLLTANPVNNLSVQLKYACTGYEDVDSIGSGRDRIRSNRVCDVRMQLRWSSK